MSYRSPRNTSSTNQTTTYGGMTAIWFIVAATCSWFINHSIFWAIIHGICGFFYILYLCFGCGGGFESVEKGIDHFSTAPIEQTERE